MRRLPTGWNASSAAHAGNSLRGAVTWIDTFPGRLAGLGFQIAFGVRLQGGRVLVLRMNKSR